MHMVFEAVLVCFTLKWIFVSAYVECMCYDECRRNKMHDWEVLAAIILSALKTLNSP